MTVTGNRLVRAGAAVALLAVAVAAPAQTRFTYSRGQSVSPAFEGWWQNEDGSYKLFFGYMNSNWEEELDVPVGPDNHIEPGGPDRGQPTHFYPRRNMFLFTVDMPADFGDGEVVWTLTTHGRTERAYGSLRTDYLLDAQTIATEMGANFGRVRDEWRENEPPELALGVDQPRLVRAGEPLTLVTFTSDDGIPSGSYRPPAVEPGKPHPAYRARQQIVPGNPPGQRFSWIVYRGRRVEGALQPPPTEDLAGHPGLLVFCVVPALHPARGARGRAVGGARDLRRARHLRSAGGCRRRGVDHGRERDRLPSPPDRSGRIAAPGGTPRCTESGEARDASPLECSGDFRHGLIR